MTKCEHQERWEESEYFDGTPSNCDCNVEDDIRSPDDKEWEARVELALYLGLGEVVGMDGEEVAYAMPTLPALVKAAIGMMDQQRELITAFKDQTIELITKLHKGGIL